MPRPQNSTQSAALLTVATVTFVVAILYVAQEVLLPIALAVLLSFLLSPLVAWLQRLRLGRIPAVILSVGFAFAIIGGVGWVVADQLVDLTGRLPEYEGTLIAKIRSVREQFGGPSPLMETVEHIQKEASGGPESNTAKATEEVGEEVIGDTEARGRADAPAEAPEPATPAGRFVDELYRRARDEPLTVRLEETTPSWLKVLQNWSGPLLSPLGTAAIVIVFVIFMLIQREDLRDRLIRLAGTGRVYVTTQALDEAAARVSRYLLMQLVINATYGIAVAVGLAIIGLPNYLLWGLLAAVMRFIPYVGPWVAAVTPIALSFAVFEGWTRPLATLALFVALELVSNNVMEPWLYGSSTGVSAVGIIAAATFWTWLWGPIGLVLSMPLTVCATVLGRHVPRLNFLNVLLSDEPALELNVRFYQRLLAFDYHEANDLAGTFLKTGTLDDLYEQMFIPALSLSERDRNAGHLSDSQLQFIHKSIRNMIEEVGEDFDMSAASETVPPGAAEGELEGDRDTKARRTLRIVCAPAEDRADRLAGLMLSQLLAARGHSVETTHTRATSREFATLVEDHAADCVVISALAPGGAIHARNAVSRLRPRRAVTHIVVGLWNARGPLEKTTARLTRAGADVVSTSISEGIKAIQDHAVPVLGAERAQEAAENEPSESGAGRGM